MANVTLSELIDTFLQEGALDATQKDSIREDLGLKTTDAVTFKNLILTALSLTGSQATSSLDIAATWNTTGTVTGIKLNVTDTASNAASLLMDLQVGGITKALIDKEGKVWTGGSGYTSGYTYVGNGIHKLITAGASEDPNFSISADADNNYRTCIHFNSGGIIRWSTGVWSGDTSKTAFSSPSAATVQLGLLHATTPTAQTLKAHDVTTGTGASLTLKGGTGSVANGDVILDGENRAANIGDANTTHSMVGGDMVSLVSLELALNALGSSINAIRDALISHGIMAAP